MQIQILTKDRSSNLRQGDIVYVKQVRSTAGQLYYGVKSNRGLVWYASKEVKVVEEAEQHENI